MPDAIQVLRNYTLFCSVFQGRLPISSKNTPNLKTNTGLSCSQNSSFHLCVVIAVNGGHPQFRGRNNCVGTTRTRNKIFARVFAECQIGFESKNQPHLLCHSNVHRRLSTRMFAGLIGKLASSNYSTIWVFRVQNSFIRSFAWNKAISSSSSLTVGMQ